MRPASITLLRKPVSLDGKRKAVTIDGERIEPGERVIVRSTRHGTREGQYRGMGPDGRLIVAVDLAAYCRTRLHVQKAEVKKTHDGQSPERTH